MGRVPRQQVFQRREGIPARAQAARQHGRQPSGNFPEDGFILFPGEKRHIGGKTVHQPVLHIQGLHHPVGNGKTGVHRVRFDRIALFVPQKQGRKTGGGEFEPAVPEAGDLFHLFLAETHPDQILAGRLARHRQIQGNRRQSAQNGFKPPGKGLLFRLGQPSGGFNNEMVRLVNAQVVRFLNGFHQQKAGQSGLPGPVRIPIRFQTHIGHPPLSGLGSVPDIRIRQGSSGLHPLLDIFLVGPGKDVPGHGNHPAVIQLQVHLRITDGHQCGCDRRAAVVRPDARMNAPGETQSGQCGQYIYGEGHRTPSMRKRYHNAPRTQPFFRARLRQRRPAEQEAAPSSPRHDNRPEELTCPFKIHNLAKERRRIHAYQTIQKESSGDRRHPDGAGHHVLPVLHAPPFPGRVPGILHSGRQRSGVLPGGYYGSAGRSRIYGNQDRPGGHGILPSLHGQIPQQVRNGKNPGTGKPRHRSGQGHPE